MHAVIQLKGHQYIVQKGSLIDVDKINKKKGDTYEIDNVLVVFDEKGTKVELGKPKVEKAKVITEIEEQKKGEKIKVTKFRRKNRYHRNIGFKPSITVLKIKDIKLNE